MSSWKWCFQGFSLKTPFSGIIAWIMFSLHRLRIANSWILVNKYACPWYCVSSSRILVYQALLWKFMCIYFLIGTTQLGRPCQSAQPPCVLKYFVPTAAWDIVCVYLAYSVVGLVCDAQLYGVMIMCAPFTLCDEELLSCVLSLPRVTENIASCGCHLLSQFYHRGFYLVHGFQWFLSCKLDMISLGLSNVRWYWKMDLLIMLILFCISFMDFRSPGKYILHTLF